MIDYLSDKDLFVKNVYAGADLDHRLNVRVISQVAYHACLLTICLSGPIKKNWRITIRNSLCWQKCSTITSASFLKKTGGR